ncbi:DUF2804 domain-containing protein [Youngiibacter multivorans]|uniref:DUF2804 domain-containing protein n=1 Tax=Youngiibacter multivorans TaxID=937251 RepID=A0ABS4G3T4_9CLOT|nr:DUF2804 domain-containing protein [Youngiibacter multivorans]MBP1919208.1 hypothetical protein [Youngiibacter multivorans]
MVRPRPSIEREIKKQVDLTRKNGSLNPKAIGWAREPHIRSAVTGSWLRKKKWNYWCIVSPEVLFSATVSNLDYIGMVFTYFLDRESQKFTEKTISKPFGKGCSMPDNVNETVEYYDDDNLVAFYRMRTYTKIDVKCMNFGGQVLDVELNITAPDEHETLNVVIPWTRWRYQFTSKQNCLRVEGHIKVGDRKYILKKENSFATLDFGRGKWPYDSKWQWATASGDTNGNTVGINLGGTWTDGTGMTENGIVVNGKLTKIRETMDFAFDMADRMKPWAIKTKDSDSVDLVFTPAYERVAKTKVLFLMSEVHQMMGTYSGYVTDAAGKKIEIESLYGSIEDHAAKW